MSKQYRIEASKGLEFVNILRNWPEAWPTAVRLRELGYSIKVERVS
jgi:hypothetical protein